MNRLLKNYSLQSKGLKTNIIIFFFLTSIKAQVINYVNNGGFEELIPGLPNGNYNCAKYWSPIQVNKPSYYVFSTSISQSVALAPYMPTGFQYPKTGSNLALTQFYCATGVCTYTYSREYMRNILKQTLKPNTQYCAKYYVVATNNSTHGTDGYAIYFGDNTIDTIKYCNAPLIYLNPQIQNPNGNIIKDTLNWTAISGTFVANGTEKYMMLGNYKSNAATNTLYINPTFSPNIYTDVYIDDVSLIELELPAFAGNDTTCIPGTSVYIGRPSDVEIDESCRWYKLPITITPTTPAIDTAAGIWVSPVVTSTYVVRQQLWCSGVKWDTVVVYMNGVGLDKLEMLNNRLEMYPNPADAVLNLKCEILDEGEAFNVKIINNLGQLVREEEIEFRNGKGIIKTDNLDNGVYFLTLKIDKSGTLSKRFLVSR